MAKITARGAKEIARFAGRPTDDATSRVLLVLTDDGRVLRRWTRIGGSAASGTGYSVLCRLRKPENRTPAFLARIAARFGYQEATGA